MNKAGCVLVNKDTKQIALIYRDKFDDISFPKGHVEEGETLIECAIRETEEEIKRKIKLVSNEILFIDKYSSNEGEISVYYYLGIDDGISTNDSLEVHDLIWCDIEDVHNKLSHKNTAKMFLEVKDKIIDSIF
jgi:8-oxo-dGTP diphosphatase